MKRILLGLLFLSIGALVFGEETKEHLYAFYYTRSPNYNVILFLLNPSAEDAFCGLRAYNVEGEKIWEVKGALHPQRIVFYDLKKEIESKESNWGVMTLLSTVPLVIGVEYFKDGAFLCRQTISESLPIPKTGGLFQRDFYYINAPDKGFITGLIVLNPWKIEVKGALVVYRRDGTPLYKGKFTLGGHKAAFIDPQKILGKGDEWGLARILAAPAPIVMSCKYFYGSKQQIENMLVSIHAEPSQQGTQTP